MRVIGQCHALLHQNGVVRIQSDIRIGTRTDKKQGFKDKVEAVKKAWEEKYYRKKFPDITEEKLAQAVVVSKPGSGSMILKVTGDSVV